MTGAAARCYLVRHGEAAAGPDDRLRPLTAAGRSGIEVLAAHLPGLGVRVAEIRHSGLLRARQTADILAGPLAPPRGVVETSGLGPGDDPDIALAELTLVDEPVLLVGHLPHLGRLLHRMVGDGGPGLPGELAPGTLVALARTAAGWHVERVTGPDLGLPA